jgi:hypothetical protein
MQFQSGGFVMPKTKIQKMEGAIHMAKTRTEKIESYDLQIAKSKPILKRSAVLNNPRISPTAARRVMPPSFVPCADGGYRWAFGCR